MNNISNLFLKIASSVVFVLLIVATYNFGGHEIPAIISKDSLIGCQFHPEKSGKKGLELISNFLKLGI